MAEVDIDDVASPGGSLGVEGDGPHHARIQPRVEPDSRGAPSRRERRNVEDIGIRILGKVVVGHQRRLVIHRKGRVDDSAEVGRVEVHLGPRGVVALLELSEAGVEVEPAREGAVDDVVGVHAFRLLLRKLLPGEVLLDLVADHRIGGAEVLLDVRDLVGDPGHEVGVRAVGGGAAVGREVDDLGLLGLPVAVDAADALLEP
ncbi:unannotated protein [freshwater metagenome]|uniref:Unannotated protein n=1 Tax=freshwater metagenome TaxID=449393 RepID=A0A6J7LL18_9ZZZZ